LIDLFFTYSPVIIEVPHFAALCGQEREIIILRSDDGETWTEHNQEASEGAVHDVLQESFDADGTSKNYFSITIRAANLNVFHSELSHFDDLHTNRITRVLTTDFPHYFAIVSRIRQEAHMVGPEGIKI